MTQGLARRLQQVLSILSIASAKHAQQEPGNPYGIVIQCFGDATAHLAQAISSVDWCNRVAGFDAESASKLDDILNFFRTYSRRGNIDMDPTVFTPEISKLLTEKGLYPIPNGVVLYGLPEMHEESLPEGVQIQEVSKNEVDLVTQLWADGFELSSRADSDAIMNLRKGSFLVPNNHLYVAYVDNTSVAMAALYIHDRIGYLNVGATLPAFRKRGCHSALTARRIRDAAQAGCDLLMGYIGTFGSISQNNMEREGMRIAYSVLTWVERGV